MHPDVCLARGKEAHWFDDAEVQVTGVDDARWAERFGHHSGERVVLDATPIYLFLPSALDALRRHNPGIRVIVTLRDPAERARSHHALLRAKGARLGPYWWALLAERRRIANDANPLGMDSQTRIASLRSRGRYAEQLSELFARFPDAMVLRFDEIINDPVTTGRRITDHLQIDPFPEGTSFPWLNARNVSRFPSPIDAAVRWSLRREMRAAEALLGWAPGTLGGSRLRNKWRERPPSDASLSRRIRRRVGRLRARARRAVQRARQGVAH